MLDGLQSGVRACVCVGGGRGASRALTIMVGLVSSSIF